MMKIQWNKKTLLLLCMGLFVIISVVNNLQVIEGLPGDDESTEDDEYTGESFEAMEIDASQFGFYPDTLTKVMVIIKSYHKKVMDILQTNDLNVIDSLDENTRDEIDKKKREYNAWLYKLFNEISMRNKYIRQTHQIFRLNLNDCDHKKTFKSFLTAIDAYYGEDNSKLAGIVSDVYTKIKKMTIKNMDSHSKEINSHGIYWIGVDTQVKEIEQKQFIKNINVLSESMLRTLSFTGKNTLNTDECS